MKKVVTVDFHLGHLRLFERAKQCGDYLTVAVQDGKDILKTKPDATVLYTTEQRIEIVSALRPVDEVVIYHDVDTFLPTIDFDVFVVGGDQNHAGFQRAIKWCEEHNKEVIRLERTPGICSSAIKKSL